MSKTNWRRAGICKACLHELGAELATTNFSFLRGLPSR
jgi:hypothetical protein